MKAPQQVRGLEPEKGLHNHILYSSRISLESRILAQASAAVTETSCTWSPAPSPPRPPPALLPTRLSATAVPDLSCSLLGSQHMLLSRRTAQGLSSAAGAPTASRHLQPSSLISVWERQGTDKEEVPSPSEQPAGDPQPHTGSTLQSLIPGCYPDRQAAEDVEEMAVEMPVPELELRETSREQEDVWETVGEFPDFHDTSKHWEEELRDKKCFGRNLPSCLKKAMADKFKQFSEYQLAKYNTRKHRCKHGRARQKSKKPGPEDWKKWAGLLRSEPVQLEKYMISTERKSANKQQSIFNLKRLVQRLHIKEPAEHVMALLGRKYPSSLQAFSRSGLSGSWDSQRSGKRMKLSQPETWERQLSLLGNKARTWEQLIDNKALPFMAMLRNLCSMITAGISDQHHRLASWPMACPAFHPLLVGFLSVTLERESVIRSRQLPFRFLSAYKVMLVLGQAGMLALLQRKYSNKLLGRYREALEKAIQISCKHNIPPLPGRTLILFQAEHTMHRPCKGSEDICCPFSSEEEKLTPTVKEVAALLGLMIASSCEHAQMVLLSYSQCKAVELQADSLLDNIKHKFDEDSPNEPSFYKYFDGYIDQKVKAWSQDSLITYCSGPDFAFSLRPKKEIKPKTEKNCVLLYGFSEQILKFIAERGSSRLLDHVEQIDRLYRIPPEDGAKEQMARVTNICPLLPTPAVRWRNVRVFISSTFRDMHGERDVLVRLIISELRRHAALYCLSVQEVELHWGVTEEESSRQRMVEMCLSEVCHSQLFVGILGERYGLVPTEISIPDQPQFDWLKTVPPGLSVTELEIRQFESLHPDSAKDRTFFYLQTPELIRPNEPNGSHLWVLSDPNGRDTFVNCDAESIVHLPFHLVRTFHKTFVQEVSAGRPDILCSLLSSFHFLHAHVRLGLLSRLLEAYSLYGQYGISFSELRGRFLPLSLSLASRCTAAEEMGRASPSQKLGRAEMVSAGRPDILCSLLSSFHFLHAHVRLGLLSRLLEAYSLYDSCEVLGNPVTHGPLETCRAFLRHHGPALSRWPALFLQQALNEPEGSAAHRWAQGIVGRENSSVPGELSGHEVAVRSLSYSTSGGLLTSGCLSGEVRLWSVPAAASVGHYRAHQGSTEVLRFMENGRLLLTAGTDCLVRADPEHSALWGEACSVRGGSSATAGSPALCVAVTGDYAAVGYHSDGIQLYQLSSGQQKWMSEDPRVPVRCLTWLQMEVKTEVLVSGSDDHILRELASPSDSITPTCVLRGHEGGVTCLSFSPNGQELLSGGKDQTLMVWDVHAMCLSRSFLQCHTDWITGCTWTEESLGIYVISGSGSGEMVVWDWKAGIEITRIPAHPARVNHCAPFCQTGMVSDNGVLERWIRLALFIPGPGEQQDFLNPKPLGYVAHHSMLSCYGAGVRASVSEDVVPAFLTVSEDRALRAWSLSMAMECASATRRGTTALAFSPCGLLLVSGYEDGRLCVWAQSSVICCTQVGAAAVSSVIFMSERQLAVACQDKTVSIWILDWQPPQTTGEAVSSFELKHVATALHYCSVLLAACTDGSVVDVMCEDQSDCSVLLGMELSSDGFFAAPLPNLGSLTLIDRQYAVGNTSNLCYGFSYVAMEGGPNTPDEGDSQVTAAAMHKELVVFGDSKGNMWYNQPPETGSWNSKKQVHSDRISTLKVTESMIISASHDRSLKLWDRETKKQENLNQMYLVQPCYNSAGFRTGMIAALKEVQRFDLLCADMRDICTHHQMDDRFCSGVGQFLCHAPLWSLEVNPLRPSELACGDSLGQVYLISWKD
ncbi:TEP1 protein, partial [Atractosteus spatula]|nr:TEP1 protein [Atractosteus spatula]